MISIPSDLDEYSKFRTENEPLFSGSFDNLLEQAEAVRKLVAVTEQWEKDLKMIIGNKLVQEDLESISNGRITAIYVPETIAAIFDSKRLKTEMPEIYGQFLKDSIRSSCVRILAAKEGDQE